MAIHTVDHVADLIRTNTVSNHQIAAAFQVAEQHRDFDSLVRLANDPDYGSKARVNGYLDTHGRDFSFPLYTFYLAEGTRVQTSTDMGKR